MSDIDYVTVDSAVIEAFQMFFDGTPAVAELIDTSKGSSDFRNTVIVTTTEGEKYVLKFASNDFTFPEKMRMWQRTVEEYRQLGYYCPQIFCDKSGEFPSFMFHGHDCFVHAEEFSKYRPLESSVSADEKKMTEVYNKYLEDIWSMTAKIAAKKFNYTHYPSGYCIFETFCPSDKVDEVLENAQKWKKLADSLPEEFSSQVQKIWQLWNNNMENLKKIYFKLPTSVFQADLNATNLLKDDNGLFKGIFDFNLCGKDVFLNYLMRQNDSEIIPNVLTIASKYYHFSEEEKQAALPLYRHLKALWQYDLKDAGNDGKAIKRYLEKTEALLTEETDFISYMH